jgi:hypothetical protein
MFLKQRVWSRMACLQAVVVDGIYISGVRLRCETIRRTNHCSNNCDARRPRSVHPFDPRPRDNATPTDPCMRKRRIYTHRAATICCRCHDRTVWSFLYITSRKQMLLCVATLLDIACDLTVASDPSFPESNQVDFGRPVLILSAQENGCLRKGLPESGHPALRGGGG